MDKPKSFGEKLIERAEEALEISRGEKQPARVSRRELVATPSRFANLLACEDLSPEARALLIQIDREIDELVAGMQTDESRRAAKEAFSRRPRVKIDTHKAAITQATDPLAAARAPGIGALEQLIERACGLLPLGEAAGRLGISRGAVSSRRRRGTILAVDMPDGEWVYPACQLTDEGVVPGLTELLRAFQTDSAWTKLNVLLAPSILHNNRSPLELLIAGETAAALSIAGTYGEQV